MKYKYLTFLTLLFILGLLFHATTVNAQVIAPPSEEEADSNRGTPPNFEIKKESERSTSENNRDIVPTTNVLAIADDESEDEMFSRVAFGYSEYGIAYLLDSEIWVAFYRYDGVLINRYEISAGDANASYYPDIAFEGSSGLFVVAWQSYETDYDVLCRAVHPQLGIQGSIVAVANTSESEMGPALDCNHDDGSCLVAFAYHGSSSELVQGRFMNVSSGSGVSAPSHSAFTIINNGDYMRQVSVAWGWNANTYAVVAQAYMGTDPHYGVYTHVYETYQSSGDQYLHNSIYLASSAWTTNSVIPTDVTYDPCTQNYLALFTHDYSGDGSDLDIWLKPFSSDSTYKVSDPIVVAYNNDTEDNGTISFMKNAWSAQFGIGPDEIAIAYYNDSEKIITTVVKGNCSTSSPDYAVLDDSEHLVVRTPGF